MCKFKDPSNEKRCLLTRGECQFIKNGWDEKCPILDAYKDAPVPPADDQLSS